jgi:hypothetical protein
LVVNIQNQAWLVLTDEGRLLNGVDAGRSDFMRLRAQCVPVHHTRWTLGAPNRSKQQVTGAAEAEIQQLLFRSWTAVLLSNSGWSSELLPDFGIVGW